MTSFITANAAAGEVLQSYNERRANLVSDVTIVVRAADPAAIDSFRYMIRTESTTITARVTIDVDVRSSQTDFVVTTPGQTRP